jgi:hypothetical protein
VAQVIEHLCKALSSNPNTARTKKKEIKSLIKTSNKEKPRIRGFSGEFYQIRKN